MVTTIQRWGNGQGVRLPTAILDALMLKENDPVEITAQEDSITITRAAPRRRARRSLEERLVAFYDKPLEEILADNTLYTPQDVGWGPPVGREVW